MRVLGVIIAILLILWVIYPRLAPQVDPQACDSAVDLRLPGHSMADAQPRHQGFGPTNLCGFYTASSVMESWWRQHSISGLAGKIDPVALAVELADDRDWPIWFPLQNTTDGLNNREGRWGSRVCSVIEYAREHGACGDEAFSKMSWKEQAEYADRSVRLYEILFRYGMLAEGERMEKLNSVVHEVSEVFEEFGKAPRSEAEIRAVIAENPRRPYRVIRRLLFNECAQRRLSLGAMPECRSLYDFGTDLFGGGKASSDWLRTDRAVRKIHALLDLQKPLPVSVAFCGKILRQGRAFGSRSILSGECGAHWAMIIGRKKIHGRCHFLIRNTADPEKDYASDWIRDGMDVWVDADALKRTIYAVQWLEFPALKTQP